jgi:predicted cytidylate kinase
MIITLSGPPGSGKSTVAKILAQKLAYERFYAGGLRREAAKKRGLTLHEYNILGESDPSTDKDVDDMLISLGKEKDNLVIEGRTAFHFIPHSFKVYVDVSPEEGARRILGDTSERNEGEQRTLKDMLRANKERMASDTKRYKKYYGISCYDTKNYDLVIDSTHITPEAVVEKILKATKVFK